MASLRDHLFQTYMIGHVDGIGPQDKRDRDQATKWDQGHQG